MNRMIFLKSKTFCLFTYRWRASQLIKTIPASDFCPQVRAKVAVRNKLKGQRADLGPQRAWEGNYLASVSLGEQSGISFCSLTKKEKTFSPPGIYRKTKTPSEAKSYER